MKNSINHRLLLATYALLLIFISHGTRSEEIKVVTEYLEPYQIKENDGTLGGFSTEVVETLFKQANKTANITVMSWARAYEIAKAEKNVMIYSISHTDARHDLFHWIGDLTREDLYFWSLKSELANTIEIEALLKGKSVAAPRNSNASQYLQDNNFFNIYHTITQEQCIRMLYENRVDFIIDTEFSAKFMVNKLGLKFSNMVKILEIKELNKNLSLAFNINSDPELVSQFQQAYKEIETSGVLSKIKKRWAIIDPPITSD